MALVVRSTPQYKRKLRVKTAMSGMRPRDAAANPHRRVDNPQRTFKGNGLQGTDRNPQQAALNTASKRLNPQSRGKGLAIKLAKRRMGGQSLRARY